MARHERSQRGRSRVIEALNTVLPRATPINWVEGDRLLGFMMASILPALFWTLVLSGAGAAFGFAVPVHALLVTGFGITAFLAAVFGALMHQTAA